MTLVLQLNTKISIIKLQTPLKTQIIYFRKGTEALVIKTFDNRLFATIEEKIYLLKKLPEHKEISNEFDKAVENKIQKIYIPPITHP